MVGSQHPQSVSENFFECDSGANRITEFAPDGGEIEACGQGVWVVRAEGSQLVREQLFKSSGACRIT